MADPADSGEAARPASVEDLKSLLIALHQEHVDYLLIGGYALYTLGYQRGTTDIDVLMRTLNIEGLLKTKQTSRDKDKMDRMILERAIQDIRR